MVLSVFSPTKAAIYVSLLFLAACDGGATTIPKSEKNDGFGSPTQL